MPSLFDKLKIRNIELKNRIVVSPMCQYSCQDGFATDWHLVHLGSRAVGGAALVIAEATAVSPEGRISPGDLGIWKDDHIENLRRITTFIHSQGAVAGIQLAHAGRKASHSEPWNGDRALSAGEGGWQTVAPSAVPFREGEPVPAALDRAGIEQVIADFVAGAKRALEAGFKVIELHAAHGYLIHEFLSPLSNFRTDEYGGTFNNRIRLLTEITGQVRRVWPDDYPLFVRISATEWVPDGWSIEDSVALARILKEKGADLIDCSSGGNIPHVKIPLTPGYQVALAEAVRTKSGMLSGAVGLISEAQQAEDIIAAGRADVVLLARQLLRDPYFALHAAQQLNDGAAWPVQYVRAKPVSKA